MNTTTITPGNILLINKRLCAERVQPHINRGDAFIIVRQATTPSGLTTVVVHRPSDPTHTYRVNPQRFSYTVTTPAKLRAATTKVQQAIQRQKQEAQLAQVQDTLNRAVQHTQRVLHTEFTLAQKTQIVVLPHVLAHLAFHYAEQARQYCAQNKIPDLLKVTRAITHLRQEYDNHMHTNLDYQHRQDLDNHAHEFLADPNMARHMTTIPYTIENELYAQNQELLTHMDKKGHHIQLRKIATLGLIFIEAYKRQVNIANNIIRRQAARHISPTFNMQDPLITDRLHAQFIAMQRPFQLRRTNNIRTIEAIIDNHIHTIEVTLI